MSSERRRQLLERDPDWYRSTYVLAVAYSNTAFVAGDSELPLPANLADPKKKARRRALEVAAQIEKDLLALDASPRGHEDEGLLVRDFLLGFEPTVLTMLAGVVRRWDPPRPSRSKASHSSPKRRRKELLAEFRRGEPLDPARIIEHVETLHLDFRARYNLACYFAGVADRDGGGRQYARAISELGAALRAAPADLAKWAARDPILAKLRVDKWAREKYADLLRELDVDSERWEEHERGLSSSTDRG